MIKRILAACVLLSALPMLASAQSTPSKITILKPAQSRPDTKDHVDVLTAHAAQLKALVTTANGDTVAVPITWTVTDSTIATVNKSGIVTGKLAGATMVYASNAGLSGSMTVCVTAVSNVALLPRFIIGKSGESMTMNYNGAKTTSADSLNLIPVVTSGKVSFLVMRASFTNGMYATPECVHWRNKVPTTFSITRGVLTTLDSTAHAFTSLPVAASIGTIIP